MYVIRVPMYNYICVYYLNAITTAGFWTARRVTKYNIGEIITRVCTRTCTSILAATNYNAQVCLHDVIKSVPERVPERISKRGNLLFVYWEKIACFVRRRARDV